jgi:signal transduction histidine kinase/DNA-binding response OmpR family regulator
MLSFILIFFSAASYGQQTSNRVDSLTAELKQASSDDDRIRIWHELANASETDSAILYSKQALGTAEKRPDSKQIVECLIHLGTLYSRTSKYNEAIATLKNAVNIGISKKFFPLLTDAYLELGIVYLRQQNLDSARTILNKGIETTRQQGEELKQGLLYNVLGNVAKEENNFTAASEHYIQATAIFEKYNNNDGLTQSLSNIGNIQYLLANYEKAEIYALQGLDIAKKAKKQSSIGYANRLLGRIYRKQKRFDEALKNYTSASIVYQKLDQKREVGETYTNIGNTYYELGEFNRALEYYFDALRIKRAIPDSVGSAYDFNAAASTFYELGKLNIAILYLDSSMFFAKKKRIMPLVMDGYLSKSEIYHEQKQYLQAHENYVFYTELKDSLATLRNREAAEELEAKYQNEKKENEIRALHAESQIKTLQLEKQSTQRFYFVGVSILSFLLIAVLYNRYRIKQRSAEKLKQLDIVKSRFFANISHEFRTPLSLILSPLQKSIAQPDTNVPPADIQMMYRNATRLHVLINQLLDLSRIESGKMKLHLEEIDIRRMVMTLCSAFQSQADQRNMDYQVDLQGDIGNGFVDRDKVDKIIYNLLSNAFKFTPDGGRIAVEVRKESGIIIRVRDNGIGISASHIPFIFDRFYQVDDSSTRYGEGTGIGLSLAKELAEVHHGSLQVISDEGAGSEFVLKIPIDRHHYHAEDFVQTTNEESTINSWIPEMAVVDKNGSDDIENEELPLVLIAEDNQDMRSFIHDTLKFNYRIVEAKDGQQAWEKTLEIIPDLVITDLMMPRMDGNAFCEKLKRTLATSHIPVVMLTAKAGQESKIDGLQRGADDYLVKPFDVQELKVRVFNLIEQRKKLRDLYRQEITLQPKDVVVNSADAEFLQKVFAILEDQFSDSTFGVDEFNRAIGFSRMQLHRKLKALTDQSTGEFIKHFRLEKAKKFLSIKGSQVSQVAYDCGFNNVSHFSKSFKEHTGMTPSEFMDGVLKY